MARKRIDEIDGWSVWKDDSYAFYEVWDHEEHWGSFRNLESARQVVFQRNSEQKLVQSACALCHRQAEVIGEMERLTSAGIEHLKWSIEFQVKLELQSAQIDRLLNEFAEEKRKRQTATGYPF